MLKSVNFEESEPNAIAPPAKIRMETSVLNGSKGSSGDTKIALHGRDSAVAENLTRRICNVDAAP